MITVYGASDDLIEVEGDVHEEFNHYIHDDDSGALLAFSDGTVLRIRYLDDVWRITPEARGPGLLNIRQCAVDDDGDYSDRATLQGPRWVVYGSALAVTR